MRASEFSDRYCSGKYRWADVLSEVREVLESRTWSNFLEEILDVVETFTVFFWEKTGVDLPMALPESHFRKNEDRTQVWRDIFRREGLNFSPKYLANGSNFQKQWKVDAALSMARAEQQ